ncbi:MAG: AbgT family transporter [Pirellulaceae bacterium]|nr:AbgT family transporter [Pirellulaceae bacterium]
MSNKSRAAKSWVDHFLSGLEWLGNLLPHPVTLFAGFALGTVLLSGIGAYLGWSVTDPRDTTKFINVVSLMDSEGLRKIVTGLIKNFTDFAPLGTVLVAMLGVGLAEHSGLISASIRSLVFGVPRSLVTVAIVFAGIMSNTASEIGYVVLVPLGAAVYYSLGRHPLAGLAAAYAGVSGGYSANLLLGTVDPLLAGITTPAANMYATEKYVVSAACNWYFMVGSTFLVTAVGTWISLFIVEPRLGDYDVEQSDGTLADKPMLDRITPLEERGLWVTGGVFVAICLVIAYLCFPTNEKTSDLLRALPWFGALGITLPGKNGPVFLDGVVTIIFVAFLFLGIAYGAVVGTVRSDKQIIQSMSKSMTSMGPYIVLVFFAAQFIEFFKLSNLGAIIAILGADGIIAMKLDNASVFVLFILLCAAVNLLMGSASAKWAFMAPIFVPMLMRIGYSPEITQCAYRIGDSCTNVISPTMSYFGMIFLFAARYDRRFGMGSMISLMFPYSIIFLVCWTAFFYLWVFVLELPIGPEAPILYPAPK